MMKSTSTDNMKKLANSETILLTFMLVFSGLVYISTLFTNKYSQIITYQSPKLCNISLLLSFPENNNIAKISTNLLRYGIYLDKVCIYETNNEKDMCFFLTQMGFFKTLIPLAALYNLDNSLLYLKNIPNYKQITMLIFNCKVFLIKGTKLPNLII